MDLNEEALEAFHQEHKEAFREAFNLLVSKFFPPTYDPDYFIAVNRLVCESAENHPNNRLLPHLNVAVMDYLAEVAKSTQNTEQKQNQET